LKKAIGTVFQGAAWQRCRMHFMRNDLSVVPKGSKDMVASMLGRSHPKVAAMLGDAEHDLLAFASFPQRHWRQIWSTNPVNGTGEQGDQTPHRRRRRVP